MRYTLGELIETFCSDPQSPYLELSYAVRTRHKRLLERVRREHGQVALKNIRPRNLIAWHNTWLGNGKVAQAHQLITRLRVIFRFGDILLEDRECKRLSRTLTEL